jgi:hypothetical protein
MSDATGSTDASAGAKRVADGHAPAAKQQRSGRIVVNVGGRSFVTTESTLMNGGHGYFAARLGATGLALGADDDVLFVDRSPELFDHVIHWLRTHTLPAALKRDVHLLEDAITGSNPFSKTSSYRIVKFPGLFL